MAVLPGVEGREPAVLAAIVPALCGGLVGTPDLAQRFPAEAVLLAAHVIGAPGEADHAVEIISGNGLRPDIWNTFQERFEIPKIREFYGATEGAAPTVNFAGIPGRVGQRLPGQAAQEEVLEPPALFCGNVSPALQKKFGAVNAEGFGQQKGDVEFRLLDAGMPETLYGAMK